MRQSKKDFVWQIWKFGVSSKVMPLTSILFCYLARSASHELCRKRLSITSKIKRHHWRARTIDLNEPRQELLLTRMKESNRRTTKAWLMYKNRATASRSTTVTSSKPVNKATVTALNPVNQATVTIWNSKHQHQQQQAGRQPWQPGNLWTRPQWAGTPRTTGNSKQEADVDSCTEECIAVRSRPE